MCSPRGFHDMEAFDEFELKQQAGRWRLWSMAKGDGSKGGRISRSQWDAFINTSTNATA